MSQNFYLAKKKNVDLILKCVDLLMQQKVYIFLSTNCTLSLQKSAEKKPFVCLSLGLHNPLHIFKASLPKQSDCLQGKFLGHIYQWHLPPNSLWSDSIIAADAKEFAIYLRISLFCQIKCLNLDKMTASSLFSNILLLFRSERYARNKLCFIRCNPVWVVKKN